MLWLFSSATKTHPHPIAHSTPSNRALVSLSRMLTSHMHQNSRLPCKLNPPTNVSMTYSSTQLMPNAPKGWISNPIRAHRNPEHFDKGKTREASARQNTGKLSYRLNVHILCGEQVIVLSLRLVHSRFCWATPVCLAVCRTHLSCTFRSSDSMLSTQLTGKGLCNFNVWGLACDYDITCSWRKPLSLGLFSINAATTVTKLGFYHRGFKEILSSLGYRARSTKWHALEAQALLLLK